MTPSIFDRYRHAANYRLGDLSDRLRIDDNAEVRVTGGGANVLAWVWVYEDELEPEAGA